jgi:hypothetical protein
MDKFERSKDGKTVIRRRQLSRDEGPFRFSYTSIHRAEEGDELWQFVSFHTDGFVSVKPYDQLRKRELVTKHGARAYAIALSISQKPEKVPQNLFTATQLQLV